MRVFVDRCRKTTRARTFFAGDAFPAASSDRGAEELPAADAASSAIATVEDEEEEEEEEEEEDETEFEDARGATEADSGDRDEERGQSAHQVWGIFG